jgi:hypothetical protein
MVANPHEASPEKGDVPQKRREMLSILWAATILCTLAAFTGALLWYTVPAPPLVNLGEVSNFPPRQEPYYLPGEEVSVFVVNTGDDLLVLDSHSPRTQCNFRWVPVNGRFEDPCCGGKFTIFGRYIEGNSIRNMDRYEYQIDDGNLLVSAWWHVEGEPLPGR